LLFDEGDDKMVKTEAFPTIRMKIDRLLKITNEYQFNDLVKAVYCINLCINNRSVLESCLALNACLIEYEEKGSKRIGTYDEFKGFFGKIYDVMKPGIADDYTVEDFGEVQLRYNDKFYRVIIGTGHNNVYACLNFLPTLARNISREEELCLALEYVSGTIDYFIEENKNDGVVEKRFVLPTEILFYKVQKFFKEEVKKYDILELDSLMMSEGTTIEKSHFVCRENDIYKVGHGVQGERWNFKSTKNIMLCKRGSTYEKNKGNYVFGISSCIACYRFFSNIRSCKYRRKAGKSNNTKAKC